MKTTKLFTTFTALCTMLPAATSTAQHAGYPITPVPFTATHVTGGFWKQRLDACRETTVPLAFAKCEESGRYANFIKAANPCDTFSVGGFPFDDTDVYKTIEGASYLLQTFPDKRTEQYIDSVLAIVAAAQEPDGYLNTARTMNPAHPHAWMGLQRWEKVEEGSHEFYNLGHMIEGAVAYYQATGKRNFLDIAIRYADCVCRNIGPGKGQKVRVPGHQIAEMALVRLYLATGDKKYLDEAKFFLDKRGYTSRKDEYSQAHKPVVEQDEAVGHAVRATYMYSGMADVAAITGDTAYVHAIDRIWDNIVGKKLYITGGIGARHDGEAFGKNYELPNASAYCETCAAIGNVYVNHRLFLFHGDAKYYDVLERTLYNAVLSGISLNGDSFFYPNPLETAGGYGRKAWFGCACCPSNLCRFLPSVPGYIYATRDDSLYVNLFVEGSSEINVGGRKVTLSQSTSYPFEGKVALTVTKGGGNFAMKIRIPGWARGQAVPSDLYRFADNLQPGYTVKVNGKTVESGIDKGYFTISRKWRKGDMIELSLDMPPRLVAANNKVEADRGMLAVERGPMVYCAEWPDNPGTDLFSILMPRKPQLSVSDEKAPGGADIITAGVQKLSYDADGRLQTQDATVKLIPYYAWANRGEGQMTVWLPYEAGAIHLAPATPTGTNIFLDK